MSPVVITLLVVGGIAILLAIGYINSLIESRNLERARRKAELGDLIKRCARLSEGLPGQFMSGPLKLLLARLELLDCEHLLPLDKQNTALRERIEELRRLIAQGEAIAVPNAPQKIFNEAKAKEIRYQLDDLHAQIGRAARAGLLGTQEAKRWVQQIRDMLVRTHLELFNNLGQAALQQNRPGQARLAFERGVQYLRKLADPTPYEAELKRLEVQLEQANALVLDRLKPGAGDPSELTEALKTLEDDDWKKKQIYD
ncbi:hypothetical protein [Zestomonas thermotolerans]|uniref:hypothetical protein n=1 Tax=Zestomonas thermotolerans TaxID=157784 RepID=UPI0023F16805|nr:hypothetical protein [Pseudomonas thermotolerans]